MMKCRNNKPQYFGNKNLDAPPSQLSAKLPSPVCSSKRTEEEMAITGVPGNPAG